MKLLRESVNIFKNAMEEWYPHFINYDAHLPSKVEFSYSIFFDIFQWNFIYDHLFYDIADFDLADAGVELITLEGQNYEACDISWNVMEGI